MIYTRPPMRIIAGEHRGRKLLDPADQTTRPVTDRVKQSLFDVLRERLPDAAVYDVFAGTGSFGLESLSRGASGAVFFESHRPAVERLRRNVDLLGVADRCRVVTGDLFRLGFGMMPPADLIFFDPPYRYVRERTAEVDGLLTRLAGRLNAGGEIVFRHDKADDGVAFGPPEISRRAWGSMTVRFLGDAEDQG